MRKALIVLVVAAAVAVGVGLATSSSNAGAITVNGTKLTNDQLNNELDAINKSPLFKCYLSARTINATGGAQTAPALETASGAWTAGAVVEWGDIRVTQLLAVAYVQAHDPAALVLPSVSSSAKLGAVGEGLQLATRINEADGTAIQSRAYSCAAANALAPSQFGPATVAQLPLWFAKEQVQAQAALDALPHLIPGQIPTSGPGLRAWFEHHAGQFDTLCVSLLVASDESSAHQVTQEINAGQMTIEQAAANPQIDVVPAQRKHGGAYGCFNPSSPSFAVLSSLLGTLPLGHAATYSAPTGGWIVVATTRRTPNSFAKAATAAAQAAAAENAQSVATFLTRLQNAAKITVSPSIGRWVRNPAGGTLEPPSGPPISGVFNPAANANS